MFQQVAANEGYSLTIDLETQHIIKPDGSRIEFDVDPFRKHCLLEGLDDIGITLQDAELIKAYEARRKANSPWLFDVIK